MDSHENSDLFWSIIQEEISFVIPQFMKNILTAYGYNSAVMMSRLDDNTLNQMETFVRTDLETVIDDPKMNKRDYYDCFYKNVDRFKFFDGQRDLLNQISQCINNKITELGNTKAGLGYFHKKEPMKKHTINSQRSEQRGDRQPASPQADVNLNVLTDELYVLLKRQLSKLKDEDQHQIEETPTSSAASSKMSGYASVSIYLVP